MTEFRGLALETSGARLGVAVFEREGGVLASRTRSAPQSHARELMGAVEEVLDEVGIEPRDLDAIAVDVGPGSFTALRVGLATARGLAHPWSTPLVGVTSFAALVEGVHAPRRLVVPLLIAGRTQLYAGFYRGDPRGHLSILRGPAAGSVEVLLGAVREALELCPRGTHAWFLGPGAAREREALEADVPGSTADARDTRARGNGGLPAGTAGPDVSAIARIGARQIGAAADDRLRPLYVRSPQATERVETRTSFGSELQILPFLTADLEEVQAIENAVFSDPWPRRFFLEEIALPQTLARVVRHHGRLVAYLLAWKLDDEMHLGNIAIAPAYQRRGVGQFLLGWLLEQALAAGHRRMTLEVRASNFGAQELYRRFGFRAVALRRGYYHDTGEDALVMLRELV